MSLLGIASLTLGVVACIAIWIPILGFGPLLIGLAGLAVGCVGLLGAAVIRPWGAGTPMLGILLSLLAAGWGVLGRSRPAPPVTKAPVPQHEVDLKSKPPEHQESVDSLFDDYATETMAPVSALPDLHRAQEPQGPVRVSPKPSSPELIASWKAARAKLEAARLRLLPKLQADPTFVAAKAEAEEADDDRKQALAEGRPGSFDVVAASQRWIAAHGNLRKVVNAAASTDAQTIEAQREVDEAAAALRQPGN